MADFGLTAKDWWRWELNPSTRTSVGLWDKYHPVDTTLAAAGTAEDILTLSTNAALEPTVNLVTNPSMETGTPPTGYTAAGSTPTQSATVAHSGSNAISINPDNAATGEGVYWTTETLGGGENTYLVASVQLQDNADSGDDARIVIADSSGTTLVNGNTITLSSAWQRSIARYKIPVHTSAAFRIYIVTVTQHNTTFFADSLQVELNDNGNATDYCDGAQGVNYEWEGTAHASKSRRRKGLVVVRGWDLHFDLDTYLAIDHTASSTTGIVVFAGTDWSLDHPIHVAKNLSILNINTGETPRVTGAIWGTFHTKQE